MRAPDTPLSHANTAREAAIRVRAAATLSVARGEMTVWDVLQDAETSRPHGKITLKQLLLAQEGWGPSRALAALTRTARTVGWDRDTKAVSRLNIDWLLDPRAGGRRILAFADALMPAKDEPPWPGFPYTPEPARLVTVRRDWQGD